MNLIKIIYFALDSQTYKELTKGYKPKHLDLLLDFSNSTNFKANEIKFLKNLKRV